MSHSGDDAAAVLKGIGLVAAGIGRAVAGRDWVPQALALDEVRDDWIRRHPPQPDWGCCGCGARMADVHVASGPGERGESYCWGCVDVDDALTYWGEHNATITVFPGHERKG